MNQDLIFGSDWYDPEDLDGSGEVQGEDAREDGVADAPQLTSRTPEASNTRGEDAGLGELHGNLILTNDNATPDGQQLVDRRQEQFPDTEWIRLGEIDVRTPGADVDEADMPDVTPRAFVEESCIRIAYLQAVIANVYSHVSILRSTDILNGTLNALLAEGVLPAYPQPVRTLESVKRHLSIDADQYITQYVICPLCWKHYTPKKVSELESRACLVDDTL